MKKSIFFWIKRMEMTIGLFFAVSVVYSVILFEGSMIEGTLYYMFLFGIIMMTVMQTSQLTTLMPVAVSMGNTRKQAAAAMQILPLGGSLEIFFLCLVLAFLAGGGIRWDCMLVFLGLLLLSSAVGQFLNAIHVLTQQRRILYYTILIVGTCISCSIGTFFASQSVRPYSPVLSVPGLEVSLYALGGALCGIGFVLYLISYLVMRRAMCRYEVKF